MANQGLTNYDLFLFRQFCADELKKYLAPMRDFWAHVASYAEREPGEHQLLMPEFAESVGYRIVQRNASRGNVKGLAAYPFVRVRSLNVMPTNGSAKFLLRKALEEPLSIEEFHCVLDGDKRIACLTSSAFEATRSVKGVEASVVLGREEVYALLAGDMLLKTRKKLMRVFGIEEDEWLGKGAF